MGPIRKNYNQIPYPPDFDALLNDRQIYDAYQNLQVAHRNVGFRYTSMLEDTQALRAQEERALEA